MTLFRSDKVILPPSQPTSGPGGSEYSHAGFSKKLCGQGEKAFWIFEPQVPRPRSAPLVVFFHGWGGTNPRIYGEWIVHLVRKGHMVMYPVYQTPLSPLDAIEQNVLVYVPEGIRYIKNGPSVEPDLERFAMVGHSLGGWLSLKTARLASKGMIPIPKALMIVQPG